MGIRKSSLAQKNVNPNTYGPLDGFWSSGDEPKERTMYSEEATVWTLYKEELNTWPPVPTVILNFHNFK